MRGRVVHVVEGISQEPFLAGFLVPEVQPLQADRSQDGIGQRQLSVAPGVEVARDDAGAVGAAEPGCDLQQLVTESVQRRGEIQGVEVHGGQGAVAKRVAGGQRGLARSRQRFSRS